MKLFALAFLFSISAMAKVSPSLLLFHTWDFNSCSERMQKLVDLKVDTVNIVPTIKFIAKSDTDFRSFCYQKMTCLNFDSKLIAEMEQKLYECSKIAAVNKINLSFVPHIDDGEGKGRWRNNVVFDPLKKYEGFTYKEIILDPIKRIIKKLDSNEIKFDLAFQGEMGATVFHFPDSYKKIYEEYRNDLNEKTELGISVNFNDVGGRGHRYSRAQRRRIQKLIDTVEFLGMSAYHPIELEMNRHFKFSVDKFKFELKKYKLEIPQGLALHFSEVGIGGGTRSNDGVTPASNIRQILAAPYAGIFGSYQESRDPFKSPEAKNLRRNFYDELISFVANDRSSNPVTKAFIWNSDSWDVFGIYPGTYGYHDNYVIQSVLAQ